MIKLITITLIISLFQLNTYSQENNHKNTNPQSDSEQTVENGILPGIVSIFPGVIIHGSGHFVGNDRETAKDLLLIESISILTLFGAGAIAAYSGASEKTIIPLIPALTGGAGLFLMSWFADIYGSVFGSRTVGSYDRDKFIEIYTGLTYIEDPQFEYTTFACFSIEAGYNGWSVRPEAWIALDDDNKRYVIEASRQLIGQKGAFLDNIDGNSELRFTNRFGYHRFGTDKFEKRWFDAGFTGTVDMGLIWKSLNGSFLKLETGYNGEWVYFLVGDDIPADYTDQYLFLSGYGMYLGNKDRPSGEIVIYYNHRRDDFTGGLGQGFSGYFGLDFKVDIASLFNLSLELKAGAALISGIKLSYLF